MTFPISHVLSVDGYTVGDRLLEGVMFDVSILEDEDGTLTIQSVLPSKEAESYLASIRWETFVPAIQNQVQSTIDYMVKWAPENGYTMRSYMEECARNYNEPEINVLNEV